MYHNSEAFRSSADTAIDLEDISDGSDGEQFDEDDDVDMGEQESEVSILTSGFEKAGNDAYFAAPSTAQFYAPQFAGIAGELALSPVGSDWASGESAFAGADRSEGDERRGRSSGEEIDVSDSEK